MSTPHHAVKHSRHGIGEGAFTSVQFWSADISALHDSQQPLMILLSVTVRSNAGMAHIASSLAAAYLGRPCFARGVEATAAVSVHAPHLEALGTLGSNRIFLDRRDV